MLTSKDLMIGDWYAFRGHPYKCTASDIASIAECEEKGAPTDISEIPITAEILEKNGFTKYEISGWRLRQYDDGLGLIYEIYWNGKGDYLEIVSNLARIGGFDKRGIQFVHQFQHALRLCGIGYEITL